MVYNNDKIHDLCKPILRKTIDFFEKLSQVEILHIYLDYLRISAPYLKFCP